MPLSHGEHSILIELLDSISMFEVLVRLVQVLG